MRLWSLHPQYLDAKGLVALWREGLLAQKVLQGLTKGYKNHPQLIRFKEAPSPAFAISAYLNAVLAEAGARGYHFDSSKIAVFEDPSRIQVTEGQIDYEFKHLLNKLKVRDPKKFQMIKKTAQPKVHPVFKVIKGGVEDWEKF